MKSENVSFFVWLSKFHMKFDDTTLWKTHSRRNKSAHEKSELMESKMLFEMCFGFPFPFACYFLFSSFRVNVFNMCAVTPEWVALILLLKKIMVAPNRISMFKWIYSVQIDIEHLKWLCKLLLHRKDFCRCCCCPQFVRKAQCQSAQLPFQPVPDCRSNVQW